MTQFEVRKTDGQILFALCNRIMWIFIEVACLLLVLPASPVLLLTYLVLQFLCYMHNELPDVLDHCKLGWFRFLSEKLKTATKWGILALLMPISIAFLALITVVFGPVVIPIGTLYQIYGLSV